MTATNAQNQCQLFQNKIRKPRKIAQSIPTSCIKCITTSNVESKSHPRRNH